MFMFIFTDAILRMKEFKLTVRLAKFCFFLRKVMYEAASIDVLAVLKRIWIERYLIQFVEFSNAHNCDRSSNAIQSNLSFQNV